MEKKIKAKFKPLPMIGGCHRQTILSTFINFCRAPFSKTKYVALPDHDWLALEVSTPPSWKEDQLTVVMVHGLCGSHKSPYLIRMARKLASRGVRAVRLNMRGCGSGRGLSRKPYRAGCSDDVLCALKQLQSEHPDSPMVLMGFSLGGNVVLKLAGELAENGSDILRQVIAVSPPADLISSMRKLEDPKNRIYERYFMKYLMEDIEYRHKQFPELGKVQLPRELKALDYDSIYLAPFYGFTNVFDYYRQNRAVNVVERIAIDCHVLFAEDDPIIDAHMLDAYNLPENVTVHKTQSGGHLGYLGRPGEEGGVRWLDYFLLKLLFG